MKAAFKATGEWVGVIGVVVGTPWLISEIITHMHVRADHHWWAYLLWKRYQHLWPFTVLHTLVTIMALCSPIEKSEPKRWNCSLRGVAPSRVFGGSYSESS